MKSAWVNSSHGDALGLHGLKPSPKDFDDRNIMKYISKKHVENHIDVCF
jgi:hypothetical protein